MKDFKWTDELVLLAIDLAHHNGYHKFTQRCVDVFDEVKSQAMRSGYIYPEWITEHIQSKQYISGSPNKPEYYKEYFEANEPKQAVDSKDWEILSTKHKHSNMNQFWCPVGGWKPEQINFENYDIYEVKRLSDGEVFTVGDKVSFSLHDKVDLREIRSFKIQSNDRDMMAEVSSGGYWNILYCVKEKQRQVLFTAEDGVEIFDGDVYWVNTDYENGSCLAKDISINKLHYDEEYKYFSTEAAALSYIDLNQKKYSKEDIHGLFKISKNDSRWD